MKFRILFIAVLFSAFSWGQSVYTEDFGTSTTVALPYAYGTNATGAATKDANLGIPSWKQSNASANFAGNPNGAMSATIAASGGTNIMTCTFTVAAGYQLNPASIAYQYRISGSGPQLLDATISGTGTPASIAQVTTNRSGAFIALATSNFTTTTALTGTITLTLTFSSSTATNSTVRLDNFTLNGTVTSTCTAPSTQATVFTSSSITATTATVGWTRGNGNNVLVVARSGSAVNADPASGTSYTANPAFGSGDVIGTGNYVVYNGTGTSVNLTGLTAGTTYHFAVYEYNTVATCYNTAELTGNFTTLVPTPTSQMADNTPQVTAANVSQATTDHVLYRFQLSVTNANTTLTGLVCTTFGTYVAADITNLKVRYSTDNVLDAGDATLSTFTNPGAAGAKVFPAFSSQSIAAGTTGYVFITADIAAAATLGNTIRVNAITNGNVTFTSTPATTKLAATNTVGGLQTIIAAAPAIPASFSRGCLSNNSVVLNWTPPATGTFDGYLLVVREGATPNAVTSIVASSQTFNLNYTLAPTYNATTSRVLYVGNATTATVTGLTQGLSYTFAIYAYKNNGASSIYSPARTTTQTMNLSNVTGYGGSPGNASGTITWTNPTVGCYDEILVVATTSSGITFTPSGNGSLYVPNTVYGGADSIVYNNTGNFVTVTGLTNGVTYYFEIFVRLGTEWSTGVEVSITPALSTVFKPGELVFVGFDGQVFGSGASDQFMVATMVDILPGSTFAIVNSRYEAGAAANVRTDKWGGAGDDPSATPGVTNFTYNGPGNIAAGSVFVFNTNASNVFDYAGVITGTTLTDRTSAFSFSQPFGVGTAPNITTTNGDGEQIYLVQGNFVSDGSIDANEANYILNGTLLHGFTIKTGWVPFTSACSGLNAGGSNRQSRLPQSLNCFNVESSTSTTISGYYENAAQHGPTSLRNIIRAIGDITNNWTLSGGRYTIDATSNAANRAGKTFIISTGESTGQWIGDIDTNWFNCANWGRLAVPDETVDVIIDNVTSVSNAIIDYTAANSDFYSDLAICNNLTVSGRSAIIQGNPNNKIEVYGNVDITAPGIIDMNDSANGTPDGQIYLYGNWNNNGTQANFDEGEGTVHFMGSIPQTISNVSPRGTELFYNVVLNNNFDTALSNDLIAQGDLTVSSDKTVTIDSNGYIFAYKKLDLNGNLAIANNGQFIQVDEADTNTGTYTGTKFQVTRTAQAKHLDYVYWAAPTENFAVTGLPTNFHYLWDTLYANTNGTQGNWRPASGTMEKGKGYIARASNGSSTPIGLSSIFTGKPHNGQFNFTINRGNFNGADYDADLTNPNNLLTTRYDDNWNLLGNPYPSAIDAEEFLVANQTKVEGAIWIWTHGLNPVSNVSPFYNNYGYNYSASDYIKYNGLGSTDPDTFDGKIGSGQGFMVSMLHSASTPNTVSFTNNMRSDASFVPYDNTDFFRTGATNGYSTESEEKHRIWLDIVNIDSGKSDRTLVGYSGNSTLGVDHFYDCFFRLSSELSMYSIINSDPYIIQGRPLPFDNNDIVPMGVKIAASGSHIIAIKKVDGLFLNAEQNIYLEDKLLNVIHDLRQSPYSFNASAGTFNERFQIRYERTTLGIPDLETDNSVIVTSHQGQMIINSNRQNMQDVTVYDVLGRELFASTSIGSKDLVVSNIVREQALIVKIRLENGMTVTRKIML